MLYVLQMIQISWYFYCTMLNQVNLISTWRPQVAMQHVLSGMYYRQSVVDKAVISCLLFIHAFLGCDTVSSIYQKGKAALISKVDNIKEFASRYKNNVSAFETLNELRKFHYNLKVATSKNVVQARAPSHL